MVAEDFLTKIGTKGGFHMAKTSEAHRKAVKKYDEKSKQVPLKYTENQIMEYYRLEKYCNEKGLARQAYIKELIKKDLDAKQVPYSITE